MAGDAREPVRRAERGSHRSPPSNLIRVMPAQGAEMMSNSLTIVGARVIGLACAWPGEEELLELGVAAVQRWPTFATELEAAAGRSAGLRTDGTIVAATGAGD